MIKVWKYAISITWTNCPPITRPPNIVFAKYGGHVKMIFQKRILLNTLMARDKTTLLKLILTI
jgi:hypothetical protein